MNNINILISLMYEIKSNPDWFDDKGNATAHVTNLTIAAHFIPYNKNGRL